MCPGLGKNTVRLCVAALLVVCAGAAFAKMLSVEKMREQMEILGKSDDARKRALAAQLLQASPNAECVGPLLTILETDGDHDVRVRAAVSLGLLGERYDIPQATAGLRTAWQSDTDAKVRGAAACALGRLGVSEVTSAVVAVLDSEALADLWSDAIAAATKLKAAEAASALNQILARDDKSGLWAPAARALRTVQADPSTEHLRTVVRSSEWYMRGVAARALGETGETEIVPDLVELVKQAVMPGGHGESGQREAGWEASRALRRPEFLEPLAQFLRAPDDMRGARVAAGIIAGLGSPEASAALVDALESSEDPRARMAAAGALGTLQHGGVVAALRRALHEDPEVAVQRDAAMSLGRLQAREAAPELREACQRGDPRLQERALIALAHCVPEEGVPLCIEALEGEGDRVLRGNIATGLGSFKTAEVVAALRRALHDDPSDYVRGAAAHGLGSCLASAEAIPDLARALREDESRTTRYSAAKALGYLRLAEAIPELQRALAAEEEPSVKQAIGRAIQQLEHLHRRDATGAPRDE